MNKRHPRKSIDKAVANLIKYVEKPPWDERFVEFYGESFANAAEELGISSNTLSDALDGAEYHSMIFGYLFEDFATCHWNNEKQSFIDDYLARRGWREAAIARRYLQAMNEVQANLWEMVTVKPGQYADVRLYGEDPGPTLRVYEKSATQSLSSGDCIAGMVIQLDGKHMFTGGILPFPPEVAGTVQDTIDRTITENVRYTKELFAEEKKPIPDNMEETEREYAQSQRSEILFNVWMAYLYRSLNRPMPKLLNKDGDSFQFSTVRFPFEHRHREQIVTRLNDQPELDYIEDNNEWVWLPCPADEIPGTGASILGHIEITDSAVEFKANSTARADSGEAYLKKLLKGWVKQPLTLHESVESALGRYTPLSGENTPLPAAETAELQAIKQQFMDQHYRKVLDEPIPVLNGQTPRECAADPQTRHRVIRWLKDLECQTTPQKAEDRLDYNFDWIWKELNLGPESESVNT